MFSGAHFLLFSRDGDADRGFLDEILGFRSVDAGHGWLIFALPPSELAVHPADRNVAEPSDRGVAGAAFYLMCDDLEATTSALRRKGAQTTEVARENWGMRTTVKLPGGGAIGLYQPTHPTALNLGSDEPRT